MPDFVIAQRLLSLLESIVPESLPPGSEETMRSLREAIDRGSGRPLVVTLVGPSGTGKSKLFNEAVGRPVVLEGVLRPTTRHVTVAGDRDPSLDEGVEHVDVDLAGVVLVDLPPVEYEPAVAERIVAMSDLCLVVTSAARYADAATAAAIELTERFGVPTTIIVNRIPADVSPGRVRQALTQRHGRRDVLVLPELPHPGFEGEPEGIRELLGIVAEDAERIRRHRRDAAVDAAAVSALTIADELDAAAGQATAMLASVDRELRRRSLPPELRPLVADEPWPEAVRRLTAAIEKQAAGVLAELDREPTLAPEDAGAILGAWRAGVDGAAEAAMRWRAVRWFGVRGVRHHVWRLAVDPNRPMPRSVRWWLQDRADPVRSRAAEELDATVRRMIEGAVAATRDVLARRATPPSRQIRSVAEELLADAHQPGLFRLTPDVAALRAAAEAGLPFDSPRVEGASR